MTSPVLPPFDISGWTPQDTADPYPVYRRYREYDPVHLGTTSDSGISTWYIFSHEDVTAVLSSQYFLRAPASAQGVAPRAPVPIPEEYRALRQLASNWLVFMDPPRHTRLRGVLSAAFSPRVVRRLGPAVAAVADGLLDGMGARPVVDFVEEFAAPFPILVVSELLGAPAWDHRWLRARALDIQHASSARVGGARDAYQRAEVAARLLTDYFRDLIGQRRVRPVEDLVSLLVHTPDGLTEPQIVGTCVHLLTAGHETTTNLLGKSLLALLARPALADELRADPGLLPGAVEELVRHDAPVQMVTRWAHRDEKVGGRTIHRGDKAVLVLGSANRDPRRFPEPDEIWPRRETGRHAGFGIGIHYCLGAPLSRLEATTGIRGFLKLLPAMTMADEPVRYAPDMVFHGPERIMLRLGDRPVADVPGPQTAMESGADERA
ncbi:MULTISPECIES: cytochrome P450 [unclassified Streptomyces]|uniref:cytochrome P450 n=1 Tax=unclassified Streptomyces TaxID=2593676 RepID=UPI001F0401D8|nr:MULTISPECIES: cytochrome P450 [unclassified Streptomyces]MCH0566882.1 cytochrome P450 [Streptomyces sp. MUM 2J]MCH0569821.1 cytochrome P450 [Streptomyces sp. MUM 136J]